MMRSWSAPKILLLCGAVIMVVGVVIIVVGLHLEHDCMIQRGRINGMDVAASVAQCSGYNDAAGLGYLALIFGAVCVFLAALADTPRWRARRLNRRDSI
jgi:TRAP-type C4-dicarboxylate transport system permease small subunit